MEIAKEVEGEKFGFLFCKNFRIEGPGTVPVATIEGVHPPVSDLEIQRLMPLIVIRGIPNLKGCVGLTN